MSTKTLTIKSAISLSLLSSALSMGYVFQDSIPFAIKSLYSQETLSLLSPTTYEMDSQEKKRMMEWWPPQ
jgi:hypothetical protein